MPFLIKIGYQAWNQSKTTAKGYFIARNKKLVIIRFGSIDAFGMKKKKFFWKGTKLPMEVIEKFNNINKAKKFKDDRVAQKLKRGYTKLPQGIRIYKNTANK
jgi:hypothetical protein